MEVEVLKYTTTDMITGSLKRMLLTHGLQYYYCSIGSQFISQEFRKFVVEEERIDHRRVTTLWPQVNEQVERQNRSLLKKIKIL